MKLDLNQYGYKPAIHKLESDKVLKDWNGMPSDDIDRSQKRGAWCLKWAQHIYSMFYNNQTFTTWDRMMEYRRHRMYAAGEQPENFYMDWLDPMVMQNTDNGGKKAARMGLYNVSWKIWSPAPKFKRVILGRFDTQDHMITANAIDKLSGTEREDMKWQAWADKLFGAETEMLKAKLGQKPRDEVKYVPESMQELEMYAEMGGFKMRKEVDIEKVLAFTEHISDDRELKRKVIGDFVDINIAALQDYFDPIDKKIKYRYLDPENSIFDYSKETGFQDMRFWGTQQLMSIKQLRVMAPQISESELQALALSYANYFGNDIYRREYNMGGLPNYRNQDGVYVYDQYKVPVMYCEWMSVDKKYNVTRETKMGPVTFEGQYGKVVNTDKRKTTLSTFQNVYCCYWPIGSGHVFNDGQLELTPRMDKKEVNMTAHVYALPGKSIISSIEDNLDQIQLAKLNLQNAQANAAPDGYKIEFGALNNINLGDGENTPLQLIKIHRQTGSFFYKASLHNGKYNTYASPIEKIEGGMGKMLEDCLRMLEVNFNQISEITGVDRFSAASQKPGETTATEVKNVTAATSDALQLLWSGYISIKERMSRNAAYRIQTIVKNIPEAYDVYYPVVGKVTLENLKLSKDICAASYGIKIEARPTNEDKQAIMMAATEALKPGKDGENISFAEYLLIMQLVGQGQIKHAIAILNFRLNKRKKENLKIQEENMKLNAQNAQEQEKIKGQNEQAAITLKATEERKTVLLKAFIERDFSADAHMKEVQKLLIENMINGQAEQQPMTAVA